MVAEAERTPILALETVSRVYAGGRVRALDGVSLHVARGDCVAVTGPSGSGKSTLLHLLGGLDRPTGGRVLVEGHEPLSAGEWARLRSRRIGFVFQAFNLLPTLTAAENVEVPMFGTGRGRREREQRARSLLERVGLADRATHRPSDLSGGECQRVAIARGLANAPDVLLADEPTGNLDSGNAEAVIRLFRRFHESAGLTIIMITHDADCAAAADRILHMKDGVLGPAR